MSYKLRKRQRVDYSQFLYSDDHDDEYEDDSDYEQSHESSSSEDPALPRLQLPPPRTMTSSHNSRRAPPSPKRYSMRLQAKIYRPIPFPVRGFADLLRLARMCSSGCEFKDCEDLPRILAPLEKLQSMVGLHQIKNAVADMVIRDMMSRNAPDSGIGWRHIVITAPPGMGKSTLAEVLGCILARLRNMMSEEVVRGNRRSMIAPYLGQTKDKVEELVHETLSKSGVMLIDEANNLNDGREGSVDSYAKSAIDTLMELMNEHRNDLTVIFAGYKHDIQQNLLTLNDGLARRIGWWFDVPPYTPQELREIFVRLLARRSMTLAVRTAFTTDWFVKHESSFPNFGGSLETWVDKIEILDKRRRFGQFEMIGSVPDELVMEAFLAYREFGVPA